MTSDREKELLIEIKRMKDEVTCLHAELIGQEHRLGLQCEIAEHKLDLAVRVLELVTKYDPYKYGDQDCAVFITVAYSNAKQALAKIRGKK